MIHINRRGITRTVWLVGRYAIKFPSLRPHNDGLAGLLWSICHGILANQSEATWWDNSHDPGLCPVLRSWLGGIVNIYPRCAPIVEGDEFDPPMLLFGLMLGDDKPDNYGRLGGRVVRVDYDMNYNGCPHDRSGFRNRIEQDAAA